MTKKERFYAYRIPGGAEGVTDNWTACEAEVKSKPNARYRSFASRAEAVAWLKGGAEYEQKIAPKLEKGVYFDAGTGRGLGVEINVTDEKGRSLLPELRPKPILNKFGKLPAPKGATNNYGELLACKLAMAIALRKKLRKVFGDSRLVLDDRARGLVRKEVTPKTRKLAAEVAAIRPAFEEKGGESGRMSCGYN